MAEAAENRLKAQEGRGIRDPAALKQRQKRMEEIERKQEMAGGNDGGLRVSSHTVTWVAFTYTPM